LNGVVRSWLSENGRSCP